MTRPRRLTARMRLTLSYTLFTVTTGVLCLAVVYVGMKYVPNYPLMPANPRDRADAPSRQEILESLLAASGYALALLTAVGMAGGWLVAGRVLRPLQEVTAAARRASGGDLGHRIALAGPRDEFTELADAFDEMLARLERSFDAQQRFAANASHELRTPLAINRTMLQVAAADPAHQDWPKLVARLQDTNQRGIEVTEALLQLAELSHREPESAPLELSAAVREALAATAAEAAALGVAVDAALDPAPTTGNAVLLRQAAVNLLQNALRHNLPAGGRAEVRTGPDERRPGWVRLAVRNSGPELDGALVDTLTEPFLRGRGRTAQRDPARRGHGLGLAIVAAVVRAHGGELRLAGLPEGGLEAVLALPGRD
ncbi:HAMP domain-containing sensor histidine kinase [Kitasatospora sp. YST-16]|uniref:sensor histidine kinase n=1 Tax=unclassified Kitasatospora TaxID=2633591 RepID=UPI0004C4389F|nr:MULTISPECIES: HAMP domain-containing sensor histidine kinase [unclassified Kitasatospora]WAL72015.1 HAMP domain-containing sensor histidine kinase [Kitasatospora sp. YST-16]WNW38061.1 HAMP domain-containing sensor histidine kinase [Streptomyces sp. Li-HN-5-13]